MTTFNALQKNARIAPRKVRLAADLVRGKRVEEALNLLQFSTIRGAAFLKKVIASAVANASNVGGVDPMDLWVSKVTADKGLVMKRFHPSGRGRMHALTRECSHIVVEVSDVAPAKKSRKEGLRRWRKPTPSRTAAAAAATNA